MTIQPARGLPRVPSRPPRGEARYSRASRRPRELQAAASDLKRFIAIGAQMRVERRRLEMTLDELANATGLNKGYLSRLERGHKAPALATVLKLAEAFGISVGELLGERLSAQAVSITRADSGRKLTGKGDGLELLVPGSNILNSFIIRPDAQFGHESLREHSGEELIYILAGQVELSFPSRKIVLSAGDCVRFPGHLQHRMRRLGRTMASALVVVADTSG